MSEILKSIGSSKPVNRKKIYTVRLDPWTLDMIKLYSVAEGQLRSELLETLVNNWFEKNKDKEKEWLDTIIKEAYRLWHTMFRYDMRYKFFVKMIEKELTAKSLNKIHIGKIREHLLNNPPNK